MQTFLPYSSFKETAECLDYKRLGKQRVECKQILNALMNGGAWSNHPATLMWQDHKYALVLYAICICEEWINRGYNDSLLPFFDNIICDLRNTGLPSFIGNNKFHDSHKSKLLQKNYEYYSQYGWDVLPNLEYWWPTRNLPTLL